MTTSTNTQNLIIAARALASRQRADFDYHTAIRASEEQRVQASQEIADAEFNIAQSEAALSAAKLAKLTSQRRLSTAQLQVQAIATPLEQARRQLWSVCSSPDEQLIVAAAKTYGDCARNFWLASEESKRLRAEFDDAEARITRAADDLEVHKTALRLAQAAHAAAGEMFQSANQNLLFDYQPNGLFELEHAVVNAAHELTGTTGQGFAFSYVDTKDLPVWAEMEASAKS